MVRQGSQRKDLSLIELTPFAYMALMLYQAEPDRYLEVTSL